MVYIYTIYIHLLYTTSLVENLYITQCADYYAVVSWHSGADIVHKTISKVDARLGLTLGIRNKCVSRRAQTNIYANRNNCSIF